MDKRIVFFYRGIRHRRGFGVHSPFVYNLITKVIEERCPYYCYDEIERVRKQLLSDRSQAARLVRREAIRPKQGALLFRLTNYFRPKRVLQIGTATGISTLYLTAYASDVTCVALESLPERAEATCATFDCAVRRPADLRVGEYKETLPIALADLQQPDFVFVDGATGLPDAEELFAACLQRAGDATVFVFRGIHANCRTRAFWKQVCRHNRVTVSVDLHSMGIALLNPKLHKRNYTVYF